MSTRTEHTEPRIDSVAVVGPGGVGGLLAGLLARTGTRVTCIGTEASTAHLRTQPLVVRSHAFGDFEAAVGAATRLAGEYDTVLLTVKATQLPESLRRIPAEAVRRGLIVPLLNGVEHVSALRRVYPAEQVIAATIRCESTRVRPGVIEHASPFAIVELAPGRDPGGRARALAALLGRAGLDVRLREDETDMLWEKLGFLAPLALMTTHAQASAGVVRTRRRGELQTVIGEVATVARAAGARVEEAGVLEFFDHVPASMQSSMQRDAAAGRPTELEAIGGAILRAAQRTGTPAPVTAALVEDLRRRTA
jgi:2-dehydropantoate 2-reductase